VFKKYSVSSYTYAGHVDLDAGANALHKTTYYYSGSKPFFPLIYSTPPKCTVYGTMELMLKIGSTQTSTSHSFTGPTDTDYTVSGPVSAGSAPWSPCNDPLPLNINTQVRLTSSNSSTGTISEAGVDVVSFVWREC